MLLSLPLSGVRDRTQGNHMLHQDAMLNSYSIKRPFTWNKLYWLVLCQLDKLESLERRRSLTEKTPTWVWLVGKAVRHLLSDWRGRPSTLQAEPPLRWGSWFSKKAARASHDQPASKQHPSDFFNVDVQAKYTFSLPKLLWSWYSIQQ